MASPTGKDSETVTTAITNGNWTAIVNPNQASNVILTANLDVYVQFQPYAPGVAETGLPLWNGGYINKTVSKPFGYTRFSCEQINSGNGIWVRRIGAGTGTVYAEFGRE